MRMQSMGYFTSTFALKTFNGIKCCGHLLWPEAIMLYKDIYICCMENCGILNVAVILYVRMWIEILTASAIFSQATRHPLCEDVD